jgi:sugar-specific transcriptional regulator TrmB
MDDLVSVGFSSQEARTYVALLRQPMATGYEVAKVAGLQRANTYAALGTLVEKGAAHAAGQAPARYVAVAPNEVLGRVRRDTNARLERLGRALDDVAAPVSAPALWLLDGEQAVRDRVTALIGEAGQRVACSAWAEDVTWLRQALETAARSGCEVVVNSFGPVVLEGATVFEHEPSDHVVGGRVITLTVDRRIALVATLDAPASAVYTDHPAMVAVIEKVLRDESYLSAIFAALGSDLEAHFGPHLIDLRRGLLPPADVARLEHLISRKGDK